MSFNQMVTSFQAEMNQQGITPPQEIHADGQLYRFNIEGDKPHSKNGWYVLYSDGIPCGIFGSWKRGIHCKWSAKNKENMSSFEQNQQIENIKKASLIREKLKFDEQCKVAELAGNLWDSYFDAMCDHPYLIRKCISAYNARQCGTELVLPIIDFGKKIWSLQYIKASGSKRFLSNGAIKGHFIPIQGLPGDGKKILICEGFATGATLANQYSDTCVIAACNAGNLKPVAVNIRQNLPYAEILLCLDDDRSNPENPGINKGREAAIAAGASFSRPKWPEGSPECLTDYNDLFCWLASKGKTND